MISETEMFCKTNYQSNYNRFIQILAFLPKFAALLINSTLHFQDSSSKIINYMDNSTKTCKGAIKFISIFAGGIEEMEARQNKGRPSFVLHGEIFPKNLPKVLNEFEKCLETSEAYDGQSILYEILDNTNISGKSR